MFDTSIPLSEHESLRRRRTPTLVRWWHSMNEHRWPRELPNPPGAGAEGGKRIVAVMNAIAAIVGEREIIRLRNVA